MILRSLHVAARGCFIKPVDIGPFQEDINVIHAPNAIGKSTLFKALLYGVLIPHRSRIEEIRVMQPWGRALSPLIAIDFYQGGYEYRITKQFLSNTSSTLEREENGGFVKFAEGEAADEIVRVILTMNASGHSVKKSENWGLAQVLWAPQGEFNLSKLSSNAQDNIRNCLGSQISGPGAGPIEKRISDRYLQIFTPSGNLKSGQDAPHIVLLRDQLEEAKLEVTNAAIKQQAYDDTARRVEDLRSRRVQAKRDADMTLDTLKRVRSQAEVYKSLLSKKKESE